MDSYRYGCEAIQGIFPQMMIRRVDLVMFATAWDIENKEKIFFPRGPRYPAPVDRQRTCGP